MNTDKQQMDTTGRNFDTTADDLNSSLTSLGSRVAAVQAAWVGRGGATFQNVMANWSDATAKMYTALRETAGLIRAGGVSYTNTDDESANRVQNMATLPTLPL